MKLEISKEELRNFLLHATDEQLAEMIEFIHPVDILEVIHEYKEDEDVIMKRLPSEILAERRRGGKIRLVVAFLRYRTDGHPRGNVLR